MKLKKFIRPCITIKSTINFTFLTQYILDVRTCFQNSNWPLITVNGNDIAACSDGGGPSNPISVVIQCSETGSVSYSFTIVSSVAGGSIDCAALGFQNVIQTTESPLQGLPAFCTITSELLNGEEACMQ